MDFVANHDRTIHHVVVELDVGGGILPHPIRYDTKLAAKRGAHTNACVRAALALPSRSGSDI